jgi:LysM repeat protein
MTTYLVKKGDNLEQIAFDHNTTVEAIMRLNPRIKNRDHIEIGWVLTLP